MEFILVWRGWALGDMNFKLLDFPLNINEEITENIKCDILGEIRCYLVKRDDNKKSIGLIRDEMFICLIKGYVLNQFEGFDLILEPLERSGNDFLRFWSRSLKKTSPSVFYDLSNQCVQLSESNKLLGYFKTFFKKKVYIYGEKTQLKVSKFTFGSVRYKIKNSGHFSFFESKSDFSRIFRKLLLKKYK